MSKKTILKQLKAICIAIVMLVTSIISIEENSIKTDAFFDEITVVFHFTKEDNDYSDYRMWIWTVGDGYEVYMKDNEDEATYTMYEMSSTLKVGYIVKRGDGWEEKDYSGDRFVDLSQIISGQVDVYIKSGVGEVTVDDSNAVKGAKIVSAESSDWMSIDITTTRDITDELTEYFKVKNTTKGKYVELSDAYGSDCKYTLITSEKMDELDCYEVVYEDGRSYEITMPDYFSSERFEEKYTYLGDDLGANYSKDKTDFRVWAPIATDVKVNLYESGIEGTFDLIQSVDMMADVNGTWVASVKGDLNGVYYTYEATVNGIKKETIDPYAVSSGVNGKRGMILDLDSTDPEGWENDKNPCWSTNYTDNIIYELHVRDFSYEESSGVSEENRGKYLAFTETGTVNDYGDSTGIDYLKDLGVTHVHLLPVFDYTSVDETKLDEEQFNWGYDPQNFNIPEGSYSTDPYNGEVRVKELNRWYRHYTMQESVL